VSKLFPGMSLKSGKPYVWVTWITPYLAGIDRCAWKPWAKARYRYDKTSSDFDFAAWTKQHDAMVQRRKVSLEGDGYVTRVETPFQLEGARATLSGKTDLVGLKGNVGRVIDAKTGRATDKDHWQVLVYLFALPLTWLKDHVLTGEVEYESGLVPVLSVSTRERDARIAEVMKMVGGDVEPERTPSESECRYCDIAACPDRAATKAADKVSLF
jgi:hypothetical protein